MVWFKYSQHEACTMRNVLNMMPMGPLTMSHDRLTCPGTDAKGYFVHIWDIGSFDTCSMRGSRSSLQEKSDLKRTHSFCGSYFILYIPTSNTFDYLSFLCISVKQNINVRQSKQMKRSCCLLCILQHRGGVERTEEKQSSTRHSGTLFSYVQ